MAESVIKLPKEIVETLNDIKSKYYLLVAKLGDVEIQLNNFNELKSNLLNEYKELQSNEKNIIEEIGKKFGYGKINIDTGELIIAQKS